MIFTILLWRDSKGTPLRSVKDPEITIEDLYFSVESAVRNYLNPSIIGQEREIMIDGKKYMVKVEKEV